MHGKKVNMASIPAIGLCPTGRKVWVSHFWGTIEQLLGPPQVLSLTQFHSVCFSQILIDLLEGQRPVISRSFQILNCIGLKPMKGFVSWNSTPQWPSTLPCVRCFQIYRETKTLSEALHFGHGGPKTLLRKIDTSLDGVFEKHSRFHGENSKQNVR